MSNLFSLGWRLLLVAALVLNPVLGAARMLSADTASKAGERMPPCHMAMGSAAKAPSAPAKPHGDCGNAACQFAACCVVGALDLPTPLHAPPMFRGHQPLPQLAFLPADAPPPARMIRPPIA